MNIDEIIQGYRAGFAKLTGKEIDPNMSDAEVLTVIENTPSIAEQNQSLELKFSNLENLVIEGLSALETKFGEVKIGVTAEEMNTAITEAVKNSVDPLKKTFASEIADLQKKAENYAKPLGDKLDATIESSQVTEPVQKKAVEVKLGGRTLQAK